MNYKFLFASLLLSTPLLLPGVVQAQYLVGIPGITGALNFNDYINAIYALTISVAALFAVIKIIIAGMKYMLSDVVTSKQDAISDIKGALFGLAIVLFAYVILFFINPNLVNIAVDFEQATPVRGTSGGAVAGPTAATATPALNIPGITDRGLYFYARSGTVKNFKNTHCSGAGQFHSLSSGNEVCYQPLSAAAQNRINSLYNASIVKGNPFSPHANMSLVYKRFQTSHNLREISDQTRLNSIQTDARATRVFLAVALTPENDWIDKANRSNMAATCADLRRVTGRQIHVATNLNSGYTACVQR